MYDSDGLGVGVINLRFQDLGLKLGSGSQLPLYEDLQHWIAEVEATLLQVDLAPEGKHVFTELS